MTDDRKPADRGIDLTIDIEATLDEVWQALTTGDGIARWFAPHAAVTPGEGGSVSVGWNPKEMWTQPITVWTPLRRMQTASDMPAADGRAVRLAVDFGERQGMKETHQLGVWLSLYGVAEATAAPLRQGLADLQMALEAPTG